MEASTVEVEVEVEAACAFEVLRKRRAIETRAFKLMLMQQVNCREKSD